MKPTPGLRCYSVAAAYAVWIMGVWVVFYLTHGKNVNALQLAVMGGAIPASCQILLLGVDFRGLVAPVKVWGAFIIVMLLSYFVNMLSPETTPSGGDGSVIPAAWTPIVYTLNTVFITAIATLVAGCPDRRLLRSIASMYCLLGALYLLYVDLTGKMVWGRLSANDLEPNNWGLMGLTVCLAAFARRSGPVAIASFIVGVATILLASSREHILALAIILLSIAALEAREMNRSRLLATLAGSCGILIATAALYDPYILHAVRYISSDVLLLYNPDRGIGSGFTGRTEIWAETFDLFTKSPLLGIGFRETEQFLAGGVPAHNAYLEILADMGLLGFIVYAVLLVGSLAGAWGIEDRRTRRFVVTSIIGYIVMGFFDRRTVNAGNPYGLLFLMCCSLALTDRCRRRVVELWQKPPSREREAVMTADRGAPVG
jgi:O-antigen ligase